MRRPDHFVVILDRSATEHVQGWGPAGRRVRHLITRGLARLEITVARVAEEILVLQRHEVVYVGATDRAGIDARDRPIAVHDRAVAVHRVQLGGLLDPHIGNASAPATSPTRTVRRASRPGPPAPRTAIRCLGRAPRAAELTSVRRMPRSPRRGRRAGRAAQRKSRCHSWQLQTSWSCCLLLSEGPWPHCNNT